VIIDEMSFGMKKMALIQIQVLRFFSCFVDVHRKDQASRDLTFSIVVSIEQKRGNRGGG